MGGAERPQQVLGSNSPGRRFKIFGSIYAGAILFFFFGSIAWLVKDIKNKKPVFIPVMLASLFFVSAYLYLIIVGKNIPAWVYIFIGLVVVYGIVSTIRKVKKHVHKEEGID